MTLSEVIQEIQNLIIRIEKMELRIIELEELNKYLQQEVNNKEPKTPYDPDWDLLGGGM